MIFFKKNKYGTVLNRSVHIKCLTQQEQTSHPEFISPPFIGAGRISL